MNNNETTKLFVMVASKGNATIYVADNPMVVELPDNLTMEQRQELLADHIETNGYDPVGQTHWYIAA